MESTTINQISGTPNEKIQGMSFFLSRESNAIIKGKHNHGCIKSLRSQPQLSVNDIYKPFEIYEGRHKNKYKLSKTTWFNLITHNPKQRNFS